MIHFTKGDMFNLDVDIRVNTVNCKGVMGAGVALAFKKRYPDMFLDYKMACDADEVRPGKMHVWKSKRGEWIINFPTKRHWREKSRYEDIMSGLASLREYLGNFPGVRVALPALGCGNGGLDWAKVAPMIEEQLRDIDAEIFVFEPGDSIKLAHSTRPSQIDVMRELYDLGFNDYRLSSEVAVASMSAVQVKGNAELLSTPWIAVWTSKEVRPREYSALCSVSNQMALMPNQPTIALVYRGDSSEEVAEIFLKSGLAVVLLLPFSPTFKKKIGLTNDKANKVTFAILAADPTEKRRPAELEKFATDLLRKGASSILFSDPDLKSLTDNDLRRFSEKPCFFIRYSTQSIELVKKLENAGFRSIGRRQDSGEPNLSAIAGNLDHDSFTEQDSNTKSTQITALLTPDQLRDLAVVIERFQPQQKGIHVSLSLDLIPEEKRAEVRQVFFGQHKTS